MDLMKYNEPIKTILLTLLVIMSLVLTYSIWTYTPDYESIEQSTNDTTTVGVKKSIESIIKPHRILRHDTTQFTGSTSPKIMDSVLLALHTWSDLEMNSQLNDVTADEVNILKSGNQHITIDFPSDVPFTSFNKVFVGASADVPETTFHSIIIDWKLYEENRLDLYFIGANNTVMYRATTKLTDTAAFASALLEPTKKLAIYREIERTNTVSLYVPEGPVKAKKFTYYIDEIPSDSFKNILFNKPGIVQRNIDELNNQKYTDGMGLMTMENVRKSLNFVYPAAGSRAMLSATELLDKSFEFVNEHGGFTADYRITSVAPETSRVDYQLFMQGGPVFSDDVITSMSTTWGQKRIFRYNRPYYKLDKDFTSEDAVQVLDAGPEVVQHIQQYKGIVFSDVEELVVGYYLTRDENQKLFTLTPSWYVKIHDNWLRVVQDEAGGDFFGLE